MALTGDEPISSANLKAVLGGVSRSAIAEVGSVSTSGRPYATLSLPSGKGSLSDYEAVIILGLSSPNGGSSPATALAHAEGGDRIHNGYFYYVTKVSDTRLSIRSSGSTMGDPVDTIGTSVTGAVFIR